MTLLLNGPARVGRSGPPPGRSPPCNAGRAPCLSGIPVRVWSVARMGLMTALRRPAEGLPGREQTMLRVVPEWRTAQDEALVGELRSILERRQLSFVFQPIVSMKSAEIFGY